MKQPKINLICDLQFGSTGKGLIAGYLAERDQPDTLVSAWSPNAGHTYISSKGEKFVHTMLPNGIVSKNLSRIMIGPGATINLDSLLNEMKNAAQYLIGTTIYIHGNATIVHQRHRDEEAGPMTKIGSTKKGCGAALIEKIRREPGADIVAKHHQLKIREMFSYFCERWGIGLEIIEDQSEWVRVLNFSRVMQIEGAQGYSLGMLSGFYPYTTSRECTPAQICVDCGVPAHWEKTVVGSLRTYPIRVANRYDENGNMIGWSGPVYDDQREISFEHLGVETEKTTVTQLPRRVFTFSEKQLLESVAMTGATELFLNFANYWVGGEEWRDRDRMRTLSAIKKSEALGARLAYIGMGPEFKDVTEYAMFGDV